MNTLKHYVARNIVRATLLASGALLTLFVFFDLLGELSELGKGDYRVRHMLFYVLLGIPSRMYELFPVAALIGTLWALSQMAAQSEMVVVRTSGVAPWRFVGWLLQLGCVFAVVAFVLGEMVAPVTEQAAKQLHARTLGTVVVKSFRSGLWVRDAETFVNVRAVMPNNQELMGLRIFEFDQVGQLRSINQASSAQYVGNNTWELFDVARTQFVKHGTQVQKLASARWDSALTPSSLSVLMVKPNLMAVWNLAAYVRHLKDNKLRSERFEIALWSKIVYPFAALALMWLALPFTRLQVRASDVGVKVFVGIVLGVAFHFLNRLFAHLGFLNGWSPLLSAAAPTLIALTLAMVMTWWQERH